MNKSFKSSFLVESAWEVCNQVGGIYTVIRSKILNQIEEWGDNYLLLGPYFDNNEFEPIEHDDSPAARACQRLREQGVDIHYGTWLVSGRPKVVLINPFSAFDKLGDIKYEMWDSFDIPANNHDDLLDQVIGFGFLSQWYLHVLNEEIEGKKLVCHFHEWMVGLAVPYLKRSGLNPKILFTTHATLLGRYLAMNDPSFYERLPFIDWEKEANYFNTLTQVKLERAAAHGADVLTTVSDLTAQECVYLLGRYPEVITPNGLNIQRFEAAHQFQSMHEDAKRRINEFVIGHFFPSYKFDLDKTLYFFTSGRFEFKNKGYDITLEALARLNHRMQCENIDMTVVMFLVTKQPTHGLNVQSLSSRTMMEELKHTCKEIEEELSEKLFAEVAGASEDKLPDLNNFIEDHMKLKFRRIMQSSKTWNKPPVSTHNLVDDRKDPVLNFLRTSNLVNNDWDKVKIVYHPDFINVSNPLFHMDYDQFVRGCHLGVFPSYYEPWGYTPVECLVRGIPAITSDLAGFGDYVSKNVPESIGRGLYLLERKSKNFHEAANNLADIMFDFISASRRDRISERNEAEDAAQDFDWNKLNKHYVKAYKRALK